MKNFIGMFILSIALVITVSAVLAYPVMLLWNGCLVPAILGVQEVTWLQAWV